MTVEHWERRFGCALGMGIYIHITRDALLLTALGLTLCMLFASMPAIQKWADDRAKPSPPS